jgi:Mg-chelatase subunit ChlD
VAAKQRPVHIPIATGPRSAIDTDFVVIIDDSGSAYGPDGTDPRGLRYQGAREFIRVLDEQSVGYQDRVAIIHFGSQVTAGPITDVFPNQAKLVQQLRPPTESLGGTEFVPALNEARRILNQRKRRSAVLFFTDGLNEDTPNAVQDALGKLKGSDIHLFVFNTNSGDRVGFDNVVTQWEKNAKSITRLYNLSGNRVQRAFVQAAYRQLEVPSQ